MTDREEEAQPTPSHDQWSGEFETDPLDSLQEEHSNTLVHDDLVLAPSAPSGATTPYEGLLADLPEEQAVTLPAPRTIIGRLNRVTVRNFYDDPLPMAEASTPEEEEADGGFVLTRERVEEYELPVPGVPLKQEPARHRRSSFALPDAEALPAFPVSEEAAEEEPLSDEWAVPDSTPQADLAWDLPSGQVLTADEAGIDPDYLPNFRSMQVESRFAFADLEEEAVRTWEIPAEIQAIVGEEKSKGTSLEDMRAIIREELAEFRAEVKPERKPLSNEDIDRIIRGADGIPSPVPEKWKAPVHSAPPPVPLSPAQAMASPPAMATAGESYAGPERWTSQPPLRLRGERGPRKPVKVPWVKLSIFALLFYFLPWADALSISLFFVAAWGAWAIFTATWRGVRELRGIPALKLLRR